MVIVKYSVILQNYKSILNFIRGVKVWWILDSKIIKGWIELDNIYFINFKILTNKC